MNLKNLLVAMADMILHPATRVQWQAILKSLPHAILLTGDKGTGKKTLARHTASEILKCKRLDNYPYYLELLPEKQTISIESIRGLRNFLGRKTTGSGAIRRVVLIGDAQAMTMEAQNALLKNLEEPPTDTIIIMTCSGINLLKPTIASRAQQITVKPISKAYALETISTYSAPAVTSAYYMSGGRVGLFMALLEQNTEHPLVAAIAQAKAMLKLTSYERLALVDGLSKQKQEVDLLLNGLLCVISSGLAQAAAKNNHMLTKKFRKLTRDILVASDNLSKTANTKLLLTHLFLQI